MKNGVLLSVMASTMIFAGGDIAPVEAAAPTSADFWGQIGFFYQAQDENRPNQKWGDESNNIFSAAVVLGVEKRLGYGFGFGAEVAGWTDFGFDIADRALFKSDAVLNRATDPTAAEVSQAYLTYTFGNTAIKAGRQALPKAVSPWAWSDRTAGVVDTSYDGIVIANTDLSDTTLVAAWVDQANFAPGAGDNIDVSDKSGLYMLAVINKSLANTTLAMSGYYVPDSRLTVGASSPADVWSIWASAVSSYDTIHYGLQVAYVAGDAKWSNGADFDATFGIAGKIGSSWGDLDAELVAGYINDGSYSLKTAASRRGTSAFWTFNGDFGGDVTNATILGGDLIHNESQWSLMLKFGYKIGLGKLHGNLSYIDYDDAGVTRDWTKAYGGIVGYKFNIAGVDTNIEYRYRNIERVNIDDQKRQRVRVEAYYKF